MAGSWAFLCLAMFLVATSARVVPTITEDTSSNTTTVCEVVDAKGVKYDLRPLRREHDNYMATVEEPFWPRMALVNLCGPLNAMENIKCKSESSVCLYHPEENEGINLGKWEYAKSLGHGLYPTLVLSSGDMCLYNQSINYTSTLEFRCDPLAGRGVPYHPDSPEGCTQPFIWPTSYVCPKEEVEKAKENNTKDKCVYYNTFSGQTYDMTPLKRARGDPIVIKGKNNNGEYQVNICESVSYKDSDPCGTSGICKINNGEKISYGNSDSLEFTTDKRNLTLTYGLGDKCDKRSRESSIKFVCDRDAGYGTPVVEEETNCTVTIVWRTLHTCPNKEPTCKFISKGFQYDLSKLRDGDKDWVLQNDGADIKYTMSLCGEMSHNSGCDRDTVVCAIDLKTNKTYSIGKFSGQFIHHEKTTSDLIIDYDKGNKETEYCLNKKASKLVLNLKCHNKDMPPTIVEDLGACKFDITYYTPHACGKPAKPLEEHKGILYDRSLEKAYNISQDISTKIAIMANETEVISYHINLMKSNDSNLLAFEEITKECASGNICQANNMGKELIVGDWSTRTFYKSPDENGPITLTMTSNQTCADSEYSPRVRINFVCDPKKEGRTQPFYDYSVKNCDIYFTWPTANVCPESAKKMSLDMWQDYTRGGSSNTGVIVLVTLLVLALVAAAVAVVMVPRLRNMIPGLRKTPAPNAIPMN